MTFQIKLKEITTTSLKIIVVTTTANAITGSSTKGSWAVGTTDVRQVSPFLGVALVTITGIPAGQTFNYTVTQDSVTLSNSIPIHTMPVNETTPFKLIYKTCDFKYQITPTKIYSAMRSEVESNNIWFSIHNDDPSYVDDHGIDDPTTGLATPEDLNSQSGRTAQPQRVATAATTDPQNATIRAFDIAWAAYMGLLPSEGKWRDPDRLWFNRNVPEFTSGGDHMIELNHGRGDINGGSFAVDYNGTNRGEFGDLASAFPNPYLEENAILSWEAFHGQGHPTPYANMEYGFTAGPCYFFISDSLTSSEPFDRQNIVANGSLLGQAQIDTFITEAESEAKQFNFFCLETGFSKSGQPWFEWWPDDATYWKDAVDGSSQLNGTNGNLIGLYGDNHAMQIFEFDTFWAFCSGLVDSNSVFPQGAFDDPGWNGERRFFRGAETGDSTSGQRMRQGYLLISVDGDSVSVDINGY